MGLCLAPNVAAIIGNCCHPGQESNRTASFSACPFTLLAHLAKSFFDHTRILHAREVLHITTAVNAGISLLPLHAPGVASLHGYRIGCAASGRQVGFQRGANSAAFAPILGVLWAGITIQRRLPGMRHDKPLVPEIVSSIVAD